MDEMNILNLPMEDNDAHTKTNNVRLIAITKPVADDVIGMNTEQFLAYVARVSNPSNQYNNETADRLLKYCARKKHWSVFEMINIVMELKTTRDIGRQILRHKSYSFQEFSQRYAQATEFVTRECRFQDLKNRQSSIEVNDMDDLMTASVISAEWEARQRAIVEIIQENYQWALKQGIAKEQARVILPEGLTKTTMYLNGTLRSWIHWILLRQYNDTQKEHRLLAQEAKGIILKEIYSLKDVLEKEQE